MKKPGNEDAFTGLELIILVGIVLAAGILLVFIFSGESSAAAHHGLIPRAVSMSSPGLRLVGGVTGFAAINGQASDVSVRYVVPHPGHLGSTEITTALFLGNNGGIDMDRAIVTWMSNGISEELEKTSSSPVICPGWSIAGKFNMLPMQTADADNILEPNEQFELFMCPSNSSVPYQKFTVIIAPARDALPLSVARSTPPAIWAVMQLG